MKAPLNGESPCICVGDLCPLYLWGELFTRVENLLHVQNTCEECLYVSINLWGKLFMGVGNLCPNTSRANCSGGGDLLCVCPKYLWVELYIGVGSVNMCP